MIQQHFGQLFPPPDNCFKPLLFPSVCFSIALADCFKVGTGKDFMERFKDHLDDLIVFVSTQKDANGGQWGHSLRLRETSLNGFTAMNPAQGCPDFEDYEWDFLTVHDCLIYVLGWGDFNCLHAKAEQ